MIKTMCLSFTMQKNTELYDIKTSGIYIRGLGVRPYPAMRPNEVFKESPMFPGYLIGNYGTIYDKSRKCRLRPVSSGKYLQVSMKDQYGITKPQSVHRTVLIAHDPIPNMDKMTGNHITKVRTFNYYNPNDPNNNLEWMSITDNIHHAIQFDQDNNIDSRYQDYEIYSEKDIRTICEMVLAKKNDIEIAKVLGVKEVKKIRDIVGKMRAGKYRKDIVSQYPPLPHRCHMLQESDIRRLCELLDQKLKLREIKKTLEEEGIQISEPTILKIRSRGERYKKWWPIIDEYSFSSGYSPKNAFTEKELEVICKMYHQFRAPLIAHILKRDVKSVENMIQKLCSGTYRRDLYEKYDLEGKYLKKIRKEHEEETRKIQVEELCSYIERGYEYGEIVTKYREEGEDMDLCPPRNLFYQILNHHPATYEKYGNIISRYDFSKREERKSTELGDNIISTICRGIRDGLKYSTIYEAIGMRDHHMTLKSFKSLCSKLRNNEIQKYFNITSQFFAPTEIKVLTNDDINPALCQANLDRLTDADAEKICSLMSSGMTYRDMYIATSMIANGVSLEAFTCLCVMMKHNEYHRFQHISSKYFN